MGDNNKSLDNIDELMKANDLFDENESDNESGEYSSSDNGLDASIKEKINDLRTYGGISNSTLKTPGSLKLLSSNSRINEKYYRLRRLINEVNEEMIEFTYVYEAEKARISKRKKKAKKPDEKQLAKKIGDDLVLNGVLNGKIPIKVGADLLNINYSTFLTRLSRKKKKLANDQEVEDLRKNGNNRKVYEEMYDIIYDYITRHHNATLKQVRDFLLEKQIDLSTSTISRIKHKMNITYKQGAQVPKSWNKEEVILKRKQYVEEYKKLIGRKFIYIDEAYFNRFATNQSEYVVFKGQNFILTPESTPKSINYIVAISESGVESYKIIEKMKTINTNQEDFEEFMNELYLKNENQQIVYVFNEANNNLISDTLKQSIISSNSFVLTVPKYSSFLNPIDLYFNILKAGVNKLPHSGNSDVIKNILKVQFIIGGTEHCGNYFKHVSEYIPLCEKGSMFKGEIFKPEVLSPEEVAEISVGNTREKSIGDIAGGSVENTIEGSIEDVARGLDENLVE
ncbi:hypothetical protein K502DRAFT_323757 [Neoconidiobolus thromboides FSU 785]|nr:hypothetical protein K502DRAFT_323757 [Neoconidiobolus thromboides FSU 785]